MSEHEKMTDDALLTAYALGELPTAEAAAVEQRLSGDEAARAYVEEVRETAALLSGELVAETGPGLAAEQRAQIEKRLRGESAAPARGGLRQLVLVSGSMAAAALIVLALTTSTTSVRTMQTEVARLQRENLRLLNELGPRDAQIGEWQGKHGDEVKRGSEVDGENKRIQATLESLQKSNQNLQEALWRQEEAQRGREVDGANRRVVVGDGKYAGPAGEPIAAGAAVDVTGGLGGGHRPVSGRARGRDGWVGDAGGGAKPPRPGSPMPTPPVVGKPGDPASDPGAGGPATGGGAGGGPTARGEAPEGLDRAKRGVPMRRSRKRVKGNPKGKSVVVGSSATPVDFRGRAENSFDRPGSTEAYDSIIENEFLRVTESPVSTFSIDVDTASYANVRRMLNQGQLPPAGAVRIEEFVNYFPYSYEAPTDAHPFATQVEVAACPWNLQHRLVRVGLKGRDIQYLEKKPSNLVFLLDVSGSMNNPDKLPLLQKSMRLLVNELGESDRVAIVVYAGSSGLVLPSTTADQKSTILDALDRLRAGGSTNGGAGIELAYQTAQDNFIQGGINRVILATDGDFNVGVSDRSSLVKMVEEKAKGGVFLSVLGFGSGNLKDASMEQIADKGNGNYSYVDSLKEGRKVLVEQMGGTLVTIAKDVKIQIEFNPAEVGAYRLVGYENRLLARQDFNDDTKDAGEIGAGHTVTAIYELIPPDEDVGTPASDPLKYQAGGGLTGESHSGELMTLKLRYKQPEGTTSKLLEYPVRDSGATYSAASGEFKFAAAVASFGMLLRDSEFKGTGNYDAVIELAQEGLGHDPGGYRAEFIELVGKAKGLAARKK